MNYDAMGSYYGPALDAVPPLDTNAEANVKPVTQTITTDPTTGEQMMTVKGRPQDLSASNPNTPTVTPAAPKFNMPNQQPNQYMDLGNSANKEPVAYQPPTPPAPVAPVAPAAPPVQQPPVQQAPAPAAPMQPNPVFDRMLQVESGNQQFTPQGQIVTSPKGALGAAQIMPATAAQPGYGVAPATPEEIATPEGNRAFGQRYYEGLLRHFGGDQQKATAAYNAGPGRVQQNVAANQGQMNVSQLPQETQGYLQKVNAPAPGAQPPVMIAGQPTSDVGYTPTEQALRQQQVPLTPDQNYARQFIAMQDNPEALAKLRYDKNAPEWVRTIASQKEFMGVKNQQETTKIQNEMKTAAENNDWRKVTSMLSSPKDEGSIAKAFFYSLIGFQSGAAAEVEKMGLKDKWDIGRLGDDDVTIKFNPRGEAKEAIYTSGEKAGERVKPADLAMLSGQGGAGGKVKSDVSTQDVERNGQAGRVVTEHRGGRTQTYVESNGKRYAYDTTWQPRSIATAASKQDYGLITDLRKKFGTDAISAMTEYQKVKGPLAPADRDTFLNLYGFNQAQPTGTTPPPTQLPPTAPAVAPPAPAVAPPAPAISQQNQMPGAQSNMRAPGPVAPTVPTQPVTAPAGAAPVAPVAPTAAPSSLTTPISQLEAAAKAEGANVAKDVNKSYNAQQIYNVVEPINTALKTATGSGLGARVDQIADFFGVSTPGAQGAAQLNILADALLKAVPRFEGPQSDKDTAAYAAAAGQLADKTIPTATRVAALKTIIDINKKYAPELDWSFGATKKETAGAAGGGAKIETPQEKARRELEKRKNNI